MNISNPPHGERKRDVRQADEAHIGPDQPETNPERPAPHVGAPSKRSRENYPALRLWRAELRQGHNGQRLNDSRTWKFDELWRAACWEAAAKEADKRGFLELRDRLMDRARGTLIEAGGVIVRGEGA
jgi:hypothetical protein